MVNASDACIFMMDLSATSLQMVGSLGWFEAMKNTCLNVDDAIISHVFTTNEPYVSIDLQSDPLISGQFLSIVPPVSSGVFLPLRGENAMVGMLIITCQLPRVLSQNELRILVIIAQLAVNATTRSHLHDQVQLFNRDLQIEIQQKVVMQELLAAEKELLSTTLMSIADGVIVTDQDGYILLFNRAAESISGYSSAEVIQKPINDVFSLHNPSTSEKVPDVIPYLIELENAQKNRVVYKSPLLISQSGERILLSGSVTSLKSVDENIVGFVIVFQNISEKQKAEAQNVLSQKLQAIGQLAAGIAHEINTPTQYVGDNIKFLHKAFSKLSETLTAYQQLMHDHLEKPVTQADLDRMEELARQKKVPYYAIEIPKAIQDALEGIERVRKIVLAMREFSHPSVKEKNFSDINHGIETTIVISRNEWKYCSDVDTDLDQNLPLVFCQIDEINQVILNMIVNAAQAIQENIPAGSQQKGKIFIKTWQRETNICISIHDTGCGIPQDVRARIFDPFFTTKGVGKGTGQGLFMAHDIIFNKHNGIISVDSEPGLGTTFLIELPIDTSRVEQE